MFKDIIDYIKQHRKVYLTITLILILDYSLIPVPGKLIQEMSERIKLGRLDLGFTIFLVSTLVLMALFIYILEIIWAYFLFRQGEKQRLEMSIDSFQQIARKRAIFFEKYNSGDILTRMTTDITNYNEMYGFGAMSVLIAISVLLFVLPSMFLISVPISILAIIPIIILGILVFYLSDAVEKKADELRDSVEQLNAEVLEKVEGIRVIRVYNSFEASYASFKKKTKQLAKQAIQVNIFDTAFSRLAWFFIGITVLVIVYVGSFYVYNQQLSLGEIIALQIFSGLLIEPMWILTSFVYLFIAARLSHQKLSEFISTKDGLEKTRELSVEQFESLEFINYSFSYPNSQQKQLNDICLRIDKGQTIGIVGKTGSGKTTLIRQFLRQYPIGEGTVLLNGVNLDDYQLESVASVFSYVPQDHVLFSKTVKENIAFAKENATDKEIEKVIEMADFKKDIQFLAEGVDTLVGEKGVSISGGQKQRLSIARAFLKDAEILLLDDSLSAIDVKTEKVIIEHIKDLREGKTTIIVTHRLSSIMHADAVIVLEDGVITEHGSVDELLLNKKWFYQQYQLQNMEVQDEDNN